MVFTRHKLDSRKVAIIDLGSHKIKVWVCELLGHEINIIWYWEKRQDSSYSLLWELVDLEWICENINEAIKKANSDNLKIDDIVINYPFEDIFFSYKKVNHNRKWKKNSISEEEKEIILSKVNSFNYWESIKKIWEKSSYLESDLKLIINCLSSIKIDGKKTQDIYEKKAENITISYLNIFIPLSKYNLLNYISSVLNKNLIKIIPSEFSISKLFTDYDNLVAIDIWDSHTSVMVKLNWELIWVNKTPIWIDNLIKSIVENHNVTKIWAINNINDDSLYIEEKNEFLKIFEDLVIESLSDILWNEICPHDFFISWWWANDFLKYYLSKTNLNKGKLKIIKSPVIIDSPDINIDIAWNQKITINILSMIKILPQILN